MLIGLDGSPAAMAAAGWAAGVARDLGGEVVVVHALGTSQVLLAGALEDAAHGLGLFSPVGSTSAVLPEVFDREWCKPFRDAGVAYRIVVVASDAVDALLDTARHEDVDMIVVGHHGNDSFLDRLFRGVSDELLVHARRPVVVVPYHPAA